MDRSPAGDAAAAEQAAGVRIRELTELSELMAAQQLFDDIWRPTPAVTAELMRALTMAGNYVTGAYDDTGLVGACVGFFGPPAARELHSHIAGVAPGLIGRSVGRALKLHQRAWALRHGIAAITWTFDPLVARNAYFNVVKLGGAPVRYLTNWYGTMHDEINSGVDSDRLLLRWELSAPVVARAARGDVRRCDAARLRADGATVVLDRGPDGEPEPGKPGDGTLLVAVPPDIEALRRTDPGCARRWRLAVREALAPLLADGAVVTGFDRSGWYVVQQGRTEQEAS